MLSDFFEKFIMIDKTTAADGFGGVKTTYTDGAVFMAGISTNSSSEAAVAERNGMKRIYTIVTETSVALWQNDRIKRSADGTVFRITSNSADMTTPSKAAVQYCQASAEVIS